MLVVGSMNWIEARNSDLSKNTQLRCSYDALHLFDIAGEPEEVGLGQGEHNPQILQVQKRGQKQKHKLLLVAPQIFGASAASVLVC